MTKKYARLVLIKMLNDLKVEALIAGRFKLPPYISFWKACHYDNRLLTMGKPFRCCYYNLLVHRISALEEVLSNCF